MKQFWTSFFGTVVGLIASFILLVVFMVFLIGGLIASTVQSSESGNNIPDEENSIILELDLRAARLDQSTQSLFAFANPLAVSEIGITLDRAALDKRVGGLFIRANPAGMSPGQAEEIRAGLNRFAKSGKPVYAHAQGFQGPAIANYFAVTPASSLWLQDTSSFSASGYMVETMFFGNLIERAGAQAQFLKFYEYKTAADPYTTGGYTDANQEATLSWLSSLYDTAISAMAVDREMPIERMQALIENAPYSAEQALESRLVDRLGHVEDARNELKTKINERAVFYALDLYARLPFDDQSDENAIIALIGGQGTIITGYGGMDGEGNAYLGSDHLSQLIQAAVSNEKVRAIVLRIDSPGGSAIASDQIHDAILRARAAGKPVVVSMGAVAASGGYYIAAPADRIIANASTLTGSIGVLTGKIVIGEALERIGVTIEPLAVGGEYATSMSTATAWSNNQRNRLERMTEDIYEDFTERVAEGRDLPLSRVQDIARGRVWSGAQAQELGLVDRIGGLDVALKEAKSLAGIDEQDSVTVLRYPKSPTVLQTLRSIFSITSETINTLTSLNKFMSSPQMKALIKAEQRLKSNEAQLEINETVVVPSDS